MPTCTAFPAPDWPKLRETFYKLCSDDPLCKPKLEEWKAKVATWADPSDSGWCIRIVDGTSFDVGPGKPAPWKGANGKPEQWKDLYSGAVVFPAKQAYAPMKTYVQVNCRKNKGRCDKAIGSWDSTIKKIDSKVAK